MNLISTKKIIESINCPWYIKTKHFKTLIHFSGKKVSLWDISLKMENFENHVCVYYGVFHFGCILSKRIYTVTIIARCHSISHLAVWSQLYALSMYNHFFLIYSYSVLKSSFVCTYICIKIVFEKNKKLSTYQPKNPMNTNISNF